MIGLPPGCKLHYHIIVEADSLTDEMIEWFKEVGAKVWEDKFWDNRGNPKSQTYVQLNDGKRCYFYNDGTKRVRFQFNGEDASTASMFLLKFGGNVVKHNLKEFA